jgi:ribose transport system permease protein
VATNPETRPEHESFLSHPLARAGLSLLVVLTIGIIFNADSAFFKWGTHRDMLRQISVYGILACGMTVVILSGGIDLSVGSLMGLSAVTFSLLALHLRWLGLFAIVATLIVGLLCGVISGGIIARFRVQPFIATLAMMVFARGMSKLVSGGQKISTAIQLADGS